MLVSDNWKTFPNTLSNSLRTQYILKQWVFFVTNLKYKIMLKLNYVLYSKKNIFFYKVKNYSPI